MGDPPVYLTYHHTANGIPVRYKFRPTGIRFLNVTYYVIGVDIETGKTVDFDVRYCDFGEIVPLEGRSFDGVNPTNWNAIKHVESNPGADK